MLDTFPYTADDELHALWMGVPLVTLTGETALPARGEPAQHVGLRTRGRQPSAISRSRKSRERCARLRELRAGLRRECSHRAHDIPEFTRSLERAFRSMWQSWCSGRDDRRLGFVFCLNSHSRG